MSSLRLGVVAESEGDVRRRAAMKLRVSGQIAILEALARHNPQATLRDAVVELAAARWRRKRGVPDE